MTTTITFNNGEKFINFGLGTWKSKPGQVEQAVKDAIDIGYRHIDCARAYENEAEVGKAITAKIAEGIVKREDLFITSKLWNTFHSTDLVVPAMKKTLADLNIDQLDLYLIHWPMGFKEGGELFPKDSEGKMMCSDVDYLDTWKGMEECVKLGLTKSIGVSNFNSEQLTRLLSVCKIKPVTNQVECHPYLNQTKLIEFCKNLDIVVTGYSPLGSPDRPWVTDKDKILIDDPRFVPIAEKHKKSPAQIALRWAIQKGVITIPKSVTKSRIAENFNIFDFALDAADMEELNKFEEGGRGCHLNWVKSHPHFPFAIEF